MTQLGRDEIFLIFALIESGNALGAIEDVRKLAAVREEVDGGIQRLENGSVFRAIRLALQCSANVSKVFWPPKTAKLASERAEKLRALVGLPEDHGLSSRALRNHIEHMDERLDSWTATEPRPFLCFELVVHKGERGPEEAHAAVVESTAIIYDAENDEVLLFGDRFSLAELEANVLSVQEASSKGMAELQPK